MPDKIDEKGKFFTEVITKSPVMVIIQTAQHRIEGTLHIRMDERFKNELDREIPFLAITDATIFDENGQKQYSTRFIAVNRDHITWIIPVDQLIED